MYNLKQRNNEKRKQSYHYRRSDIPNLLDIAIIRILFINFKSIKIMGQKTYKKTILSDFNEEYKKKIGAEVAVYKDGIGKVFKNYNQAKERYL